MLDSTIQTENLRPANAGEAATNMLHRFLKPLSENPSPGTTGMGAIKKE